MDTMQSRFGTLRLSTKVAAQVALVASKRLGTKLRDVASRGSLAQRRWHRRAAGGRDFDRGVTRGGDARTMRSALLRSGLRGAVSRPVGAHSLAAWWLRVCAQRHNAALAVCRFVAPRSEPPRPRGRVDSDSEQSELDL